MLIEKYATVILSPSDITLEPGATTLINAQFTPPTGVNTELLPVYSDFIKIEGDDIGTQHIGYAGAATSMKSLNLEGAMRAKTVFWY